MVPGSGPEPVYDHEHFAPQAVHSFQDYPPEVAYSNYPVPAHDPHDYPPEHVSEHDSDNYPLKDKPTKSLGIGSEAPVKEIERSDTAHWRPRSRRKWQWIALAVVAIILVGAGVGLGVGLTIGRKSRFV